MIDFNNIKILVNGIHSTLPNGKIQLHSSSVLIKTNKNILVDTSSFSQREELLNNLKNENLNPEDINMVILTHLHLDHIANFTLFPNAKIYLKFNSNYPGQCQDIIEGTISRADINNLEIPDIKIINTPGHSLDSISVVVDTDKGKVAICGDAIASKEYLNLESLPLEITLADVNMYKKSRCELLSISDYIIPGHGDILKIR